MEEKIILANFIALKRKEIGLTQDQVALIMGMARSTYQDREKGSCLDYCFVRDFCEKVLLITFAEFDSRYKDYLRRREIQL